MGKQQTDGNHLNTYFILGLGEVVEDAEGRLIRKATL